MALTDHRLAPLAGGSPDSVVIFLHGLGDSGSGGLLDIGRLWQQVLPRTEFLCPDAPFAFDQAPPEFSGRQWFSLRDFSPQEIEQGVKQAAPILDNYIDGVLAARKLQASKLALVGFSQGCMMALYTALRRKDAVAAVIGYSGALIGAAALAADRKSAPPILLVHGRLDEVVPFQALAMAEQGLKAAGVEVRTVACPQLGHSIDEDGIRAGADFLRSRL